MLAWIEPASVPCSSHVFRIHAGARFESGAWVLYSIYTKWCIYIKQIQPRNETHKILWDFAIQTDRTIPARKIRLSVNFKEKSEKTYKYLDLAWELKIRLWRMRVTVFIIGAGGTCSEGLNKNKNGGIRNLRKNRDNVVEIG